MFQYTNEDNFNKIRKQVQQKRKLEQERKEMITVVGSEPINREYGQSIATHAQMCTTNSVSQHYESTASKECLDQGKQLSDSQLFQQNSSDKYICQQNHLSNSQLLCCMPTLKGNSIKQTFTIVPALDYPREFMLEETSNILSTSNDKLEKAYIQLEDGTGTIKESLAETTGKHCHVVTNVPPVNGFVNGQQCDKHVHRILQFRKKILAELNNMESLKYYLYEPDGVQESLRVEKREKEFHTRFNRNYMFQLKIQLCEVEQCDDWKQIPQKLATAYCTAFQSLQALFHQMFSSTCSKIINKLYKMLLKLNKLTAFYQNVGICYITKTEDEINEFNDVCRNLLRVHSKVSYRKKAMLSAPHSKPRCLGKSSTYSKQTELNQATIIKLAKAKFGSPPIKKYSRNNKHERTHHLKLSMDRPSLQLSKLCITETDKNRMDVESSTTLKSTNDCTQLNLPTSVSREDTSGETAGRNDDSPTETNTECGVPDVHKKSIYIQTEPYDQGNLELLSTRTVGLQHGKPQIQRYKHLCGTNVLDTSDQSSEVSEIGNSANGLNMLISELVSKSCHHQNVVSVTNSLAIKKQRVKYASYKTVSDRISDSDHSGTGNKKIFENIKVVGEICENQADESVEKSSVSVNDSKTNYTHLFERQNDKLTSTCHDAITQTNTRLGHDEEHLLLVEQNGVSYSNELAPLSESSVLLNTIERISNSLVQEILQNVVAEMGSEVLINMMYQQEFDLLHS